MSIGISLSIVTIIFFIAIPLHWELRVWKWFAVIIVTTAAWVWMWHASSNKKRRFAYILSVLSIIMISTIFQHGFNQFEIPQQSVVKVTPWKIVYVKNTEQLIQDSTMIGVKDATTGEYIIEPIIRYDSLFFKRGWEGMGWIHAPEGVVFENVPFAGNTDATFFSGIRNTKCRVYIAPPILTFEKQRINASLAYYSSREDSINYYSALLYRQLRNQTIKMMKNPQVHSYCLDSLTAYHELEKVVHNAFLEYKERFSLFAKDTFSEKHLVTRSRITTLTDKEMSSFLRQLSQYFFLVSLGDRIQHDDIANIVTMHKTYLLLFFYDCPGLNITVSQEQNINGNERIIVSGIDILENRMFAWHELFQLLCMADASYNLNSFKSRVTKATESFDMLLSELRDTLSIQLDKQRSVNFKFKEAGHGIAKSIAENDSKSAMEEMVNRYDLIREAKKLHLVNSAILGEDALRNALKETVDDILLSYTDEDPMFLTFREEVQSIIVPIMKQYGTNAYYNVFATILKDIASVSMLRSYDSKMLVDEYDKAEKFREENFNEFKKVSNIDSLKNIIKHTIDSVFNKR